MSIFISYRRGITQDVVARIKQGLQQSFDDVFHDIGSIGIGDDFVARTRQAMERANAVLIVIGPDWTRGDSLHSPDDFVRMEVEQALARDDILVVPVLVGGADMPDARDLPASMHGLLRRNAVVVDSGADFDHHIERLAAAIALYVPRRSVPDSLKPSSRGPRPNNKGLRALVPMAAGVGALGVAVMAFMLMRGPEAGGPTTGPKAGAGGATAGETVAGEGAAGEGAAGGTESGAGSSEAATGGVHAGDPAGSDPEPPPDDIAAGTDAKPASKPRTCASTHRRCPKNASCVDTKRGPQCRCNAGYEGQGDRECTPVPQTCAQTKSSCPANARCVDTAGGPECQCNRGFVKDRQGQCVAECTPSRETCNTRDDDCDGRIDEGRNLPGCKSYGFDRDGDGYYADIVCLCRAEGGRVPVPPRHGTDPNDCVTATSSFQVKKMPVCQGRSSTASWDWNHDGRVEEEFPSAGMSRSKGFGKGCDVRAGWQGSVAACGTTGTWIKDCNEIAGSLHTQTTTRQQRCR